jgi:hypothetical protein
MSQDTEQSEQEGTLAGVLNVSGEVSRPLPLVANPPTQVSLQRSATRPTGDLALWVAIRNRTDAISFDRYSAFVHRLLCRDKDESEAATQATFENPYKAGSFGAPSVKRRRTELAERPTIYGIDAYRLLEDATRAFLTVEGGVVIQPPRDPETGAYPSPPTDMPTDETPGGVTATYEQAQLLLERYLETQIGTLSDKRLPYLKRIVQALLPPGSRGERLPFCDELLQNRFSQPPMIEYIWNFYKELAGLPQTLNAIALRFQNRRRTGHDPLAELTLGPLRPVNNLLWGFVQSETSRLSVLRRAHEYRSQYGLTLQGRAVRDFAPADHGPQFLARFHELIWRANIFFKEDANTTVISDGFRMLQALKQLHLELAHGAVNQSAELTMAARCEMLVMQYIVARPELREFLRGRPMVPYQEAWMEQVETMTRLQGWSNTSVSIFRDLAVVSERLVLSARYGDWTATNDQEQARNWARYWKPEIQCYTHAYNAATGVDLSAEANTVGAARLRAIQPAFLIQQRALEAQRRGRLSEDTDLDFDEEDENTTSQLSPFSDARKR